MSASLTQSADFALSPKGHLLVDSESPFKAFASADILFDLARDTDDAILSPIGVDSLITICAFFVRPAPRSRVFARRETG